MKQRPRIYYSDAQKELMWDRWQKGDSMHAIARLFDRGHGSIQGILSETGGIRPLPRSRSRLSLTLAEREEISRGVVAGHSIRSIAASLGRAPSTVSREVNRNGGRRRYRASQADQAAWDRAHRPKRCKLVENRALARIVAKKLKQLWSPEQIAGWLKRTYPDDESYQVSHETIYRSLYIQARGALKKELLQHLRRTRVMRRSRHHTQKTADHGRIAGGRVPEDRVIDGIDVFDLLKGKSEESGRDGFVVYMGNDIFGVKWRDWKIHFKEQSGWNGVLREYTMPRVYNLINDPFERDNVLFPNTWVLRTGLPQLEEHVVSLKKYPPIPNGAPDPYEPPY